MNCEEARAALLDWLAGPMAANTDPRIANHIATCEACRQFAAAQRSLDARLTAAVPQVSLSPEFRTTLRARLHKPQPRT